MNDLTATLSFGSTGKKMFRNDRGVNTILGISVCAFCCGAFVKGLPFLIFYLSKFEIGNGPVLYKNFDDVLLDIVLTAFIPSALESILLLFTFYIFQKIKIPVYIGAMISGVMHYFLHGANFIVIDIAAMFFISYFAVWIGFRQWNYSVGYLYAFMVHFGFNCVVILYRVLYRSVL